VLEQQNNLQLNIRCASDSYSFDMRASATLASNAVSGSWSESSRNVAGKISGTADGDLIDVVANGPAFSASLALNTNGDLQSVVIKSKEANASVKGATISLHRS
jgi:hypothetical protein